MNRLRQFWHAARKVFDLPRRLRAVRDSRGDPQVPTVAVSATLFLGALLRMPSFLQLQFESARPGWQRLIDHAHPITDDRMVYVCQRDRLEDWRQVLAFNLFEWFGRLHSKLPRSGAITLAELARQLDRALERHEEIQPLWSG